MLAAVYTGNVHTQKHTIGQAQVTSLINQGLRTLCKQSNSRNRQRMVFLDYKELDKGCLSVPLTM